eukprot:scaffold2901_cov91-Skeletonema_dohrnii-CCMP3373.AAC.2
MATARDSSKRRKLLGDASPDDAGCLSDLPSGVLTHVANYLALPSRALFAAALTTHQNTAASDERNTAIVGNEWTTLDFGDIEEDLAVRLSDGDISAVLICIDAANRVKKLKLTNITGVGLEPLRGSTTIEQIDLSLFYDRKHPDFCPAPLISCDDVLPILDSIIDREGSLLRHLHLPSEWKGEFQFDQFLRRYNEMLVNRGVISCVKCNTHVPPQDGSWINFSGWGDQNYTCYDCLQHYCKSCTTPDDAFMNMLCYCDSCDRRFCADCKRSKKCSCCDKKFCGDCKDFIDCSSAGCDADICDQCIYEAEPRERCCKCERNFCQGCSYQLLSHCDSCKKSFCYDCRQEEDDPIMSSWRCCGRCNHHSCHNCCKETPKGSRRLCKDCDHCSSCIEVTGGDLSCYGCRNLALTLLHERYRENIRLKTENKELKKQVEELEEKMKSLAT